MIRRCPTPLTMLVAALAIGLGSRPISTQADTVNSGTPTSTATYTLTSTTGLPVPDANISGPQVEALVVPTGGVVPPSNGAGPLTILAGSTGFDATQLVDALKNTTNSGGQPVQYFGLVFFGQGLAAGGVLNFTLTVENSLKSAPLLESLTPGISIKLDAFTPTASATTSSSSSPTPDTSGASPQVPEPLSLIVWSALACAGLSRVRAQRRARQVALAD